MREDRSFISVLMGREMRCGEEHFALSGFGGSESRHRRKKKIIIQFYHGAWGVDAGLAEVDVIVM